MRASLRREHAPALAYAAGALFLAHVAMAALVRHDVAAAAVHLVFVPALLLLVLHVEAPSWARLAGHAWAASALAADVAMLGSAAAGVTLGPAHALADLALLPGAVWIYGASILDEGPGHALGAAAAAAFVFSGALGLAQQLILVADWPLGRMLEPLALVLAIVWFGVLGKDLAAGKRHLGGPVRVVA